MSTEFAAATQLIACSPLLQQIAHHLQQTLKPHRYQHSLAVMLEAIALAERHGLDQQQAALAGLAHDLGRAYADHQLLALARQYQLPVDAEEEARPFLLHGPVAAALLQAQWQITDTEVLAAIATHTVARPDMGPLAQLIYLADLLEPGRDPWPGQAQIRSLAEQDLEQALLLALADGFAHLQAQGISPHSASLAAYQQLQQKLSEPKA